MIGVRGSTSVRDIMASKDYCAATKSRTCAFSKPRVVHLMTACPASARHPTTSSTRSKCCQYQTCRQWRPRSRPCARGTASSSLDRSRKSRVREDESHEAINGVALHRLNDPKGPLVLLVDLKDVHLLLEGVVALVYVADRRLAPVNPHVGTLPWGHDQEVASDPRACDRKSRPRRRSPVSGRSR